MARPPLVRLALYVDESGRFEEPWSTQRFPSQFAGFVFRLGDGDDPRSDGRFERPFRTATSILEDAHRAAGMTLGDEFHSKDLGDEQLRALVMAAVAALARSGIQPVRIVNVQRVDYGSRVRNTVHVLAELLVRLCQAIGGSPRVHVHLLPAEVVLSHEGSYDEARIGPEWYEAAIRAAFAFAAVRRGLGAEHGRWSFTLTLGSGKLWRELQLCDLLSHASHSDFARCDPEAADALRRAFGAYDFELLVRLKLDLVDDLLEQRSLGLALQLLGEEELGGGTSAAIAERRARALDHLRRLPPAAREAMANQLLGWLDGLVEGRVDFGLAKRVGEWLIDHVVAGLRSTDASVAADDALEYAVRRRLMAAANHAGKLTVARREEAKLEALVPGVMGRLDALAEIVEARVTAAVLHTDAQEYERVEDLLSPLVKFFENLSALSEDLGLPVSAARSGLRGKTLGTLLQARIYASDGDATRLAAARALSDQALGEFTDPGDVSRQQQYRCLLETVGGDFAAARGWLARSIGLDVADHAALGAKIAALGLGFPLLHWTRLGARAWLAGATSEGQAFRAAFGASGVLTGPWFVDRDRAYPAHGIRRHAAFAAAAWGDLDGAERLLTRGRELQAFEQRSLVLAVIQVGGQLEVAGLSAPRDGRRAKRLLREVQGTLAKLRDALGNEGFDSLADRLAAWVTTVERVDSGVLEGEAARDALLACGRQSWW